MTWLELAAVAAVAAVVLWAGGRARPNPRRDTPGQRDSGGQVSRGQRDDALGTVRVGESLYPVTRVWLGGGAWQVQFRVTGDSERDVWMLYGPDGELVFRSAEVHPELGPGRFPPASVVVVTWSCGIVDKVSTRRTP